MRIPPFPSRNASRDREDLHTAMLVTAGAALAGGALAWTWLRTHRDEAPGRPGARTHGAPSDKSGIGTAPGSGDGSASPVWFTLNHGALTEVYYPRPDHPCLLGLALAVTDGRSWFSDERYDAEHHVERTVPGALAYRLVNTCKDRRYRIEKTTVANPSQAAVVQHVRFTPLRGSLEDYRLYALMNPHMGLRRRVGSTGWVGSHKGRPVLFARRGDEAMALDSSAPWGQFSAGFIGASDARIDLRRHARLTRTYTHAGQGNVLLAGEIDLLASGGSFTLALGLGSDPHEAAHQALASLISDFDDIEKDYVNSWNEWQAGLAPLDSGEPSGHDLYRASTAVLRAHEARTVPGAAVASLSTPWGQIHGDDNQGGYHLVWPRDLAEVAGGLLAAGARPDARRILDYLQATQEPDGHWSQNMWINGETYWSGIQMGEAALPLLLLDLLDREDALSEHDLRRFWPMVRQAVRYIVLHGPSSQEDRWENANGFTPFTLSALIAGLLVAADLADRQGEPASADFLRETADAWHASIDYWTYVEDTPLARQIGVDGYYLRIAPPDDDGMPMKTHGHLQVQTRRSTEGRLVPADIVSPDALAYVRFGLLAPDDPRILNTIRVIDTVLKVETPFGPSWRRYNHDGYGEKPDGSPFDGHSGVGRAWPLLTGERAHYELASGNRDEAERLLHAFEQFAGVGGLLPEQVWDTRDVPEHGLYLGRPSGSAMPLAWAHAEYVKLRRSLHDGRLFDMPALTARRYLVDRVVSPLVIWRPDHLRRALPAGKILRIALRSPAVVLWNADGAPGPREAPTRDSTLGVHYADLPTDRLPSGSRIQLTVSRPVGSNPNHAPDPPVPSSVVMVT